ncbi:uncharacterized protein LOC108665476 [Hyalella azteca]|uniref:Uncharacterized protein LOC108665476 n=1 Tax=Hyalella azteca TaxID=294128 RepID=A0A8B7N3A8_HYAAZ|nr:uncharacterized protein LOC108665476 [Hyalella azteca]
MARATVIRTSKVAPCAEAFRPSVGPVASSVECVVEVLIKVHLKGVSADIAKYIQVEPIVSTQVFFKQRKAEEFEKSVLPATTTSFFGTELLTNDLLSPEDEIEYKTLATKRVTFCDYITAEDECRAKLAGDLSSIKVKNTSPGILKKNGLVSYLKSDGSQTESFTVENDSECEVTPREFKTNAVLSDDVILAEENSVNCISSLPQPYSGSESILIPLKDNTANKVEAEQPLEQKLSAHPTDQTTQQSPTEWKLPEILQHEVEVYRLKNATTAQNRRVNYKMATETDQIAFNSSLKDYLTKVGLEDLWGYLKVLGCFVVGDLQYLEPSELLALPVLARRRLATHLAAIKLKLPQCKKDASLKEVLQEQGLDHALGYVVALGADTLADLRLLTEDDLAPLPPLTKRRLAVISDRCTGKDKDNGAAPDYLM